MVRQTLGYALGGGGVVTNSIRAFNEVKPREDSRTVGNGLLSVKLLAIIGNIRHVRWVGIPNVADLLLGLASSSCELSYF